MDINKEKFTAKFHAEYEKLNPQQKLAVDTIEGPVMVIAGPGTGKTQILASRIGKILLDTDAGPENILCLTFTEAGVVAMRKRLLQFIGPAAYKVTINTFHAFCNDVIQDNLSLFEKTALDPLSDLERIQYLKDLIDGFSKENPLKRYRGDVYYEINGLTSLFNNMKKEGWSPAFINEKIDEYLNDLPNRKEFIYSRKYKEFKAGDVKQHLVDDETIRMEKLRAAVGEFENFQQIMRKHDRYDFNDMINWVIKAFEENKNLLANYQEQYQYILVDEYQDTSGTQNRIVELLINYWDKPNIFVVGDDDQSIFRFQGANIENMKLFADKYVKDLKTIVLTNNYRSTQPILDVSISIIEKNTDRLVNQLPELSKELVSANAKINQLTHTPRIKEYETLSQEMMGIVKDVQELLLREIQPGRIGIIYKENKYGDELATYFNLLDIPVYTKRDMDILLLPEGKKIALVLEYLAAEHDTPYSGDEMLFEILHFNWFGIPPIEIAKLTMEVSAIRYGAKKTSLRQLLNEKALAPAKDLFTSNMHEGLQRASIAIEKLIGDVPNVTLQHLFENIIKDAGILKFIMESTDKHWQLQILTSIFNFIKEETHRNPLLNLKQLVSLIELMEKEKISLPLVQVSGNDKGINLMTVHGSKGLEFEHVFFAGCSAKFWEKKQKSNRGFKLPDTLFETAQDDGHPSNADDRELRRLFYVALTRAETNLIISYSKYRNDGKPLEPSEFVAEILDQHNIFAELIEMDDKTLDDFSILQFSTASRPEIEKIEENYISPLLEKFQMNVTALNNYLKCPLEFYFKNLIRIPSPRNEATEFGSAVHYALEKLFRKMQDDPKNKFPSVAEFVNDFEWYLHRHRECFTKEQFDRRIEYGQEILKNYYANYIDSFNKVVTIERNINNVVVSGVPLKGKLDKLEFDGKSVIVVDYKSGNPENGIKKMKGPSDKDPNGGDYWRQAVFYKILVDNYEQKDWKVVSSEFDFIEPDSKKNYRKERIVISPADITTVTQQIINTWEKIQNRDFYTGCGSEECHWCNFVKTNEMGIAFHELEAQDADDL